MADFGALPLGLACGESADDSPWLLLARRAAWTPPDCCCLHIVAALLPPPLLPIVVELLLEDMVAKRLLPLPLDPLPTDRQSATDGCGC